MLLEDPPPEPTAEPNTTEKVRVTRDASKSQHIPLYGLLSREPRKSPGRRRKAGSEPPAKRSSRVEENPFRGTAIMRTPDAPALKWSGEYDFISPAKLTDTVIHGVTASSWMIYPRTQHTVTRESSSFEYRGHVPRRRFKGRDGRFASP